MVPSVVKLTRIFPLASPIPPLSYFQSALEIWSVLLVEEFAFISVSLIAEIGGQQVPKKARPAEARYILTRFDQKPGDHCSMLTNCPSMCNLRPTGGR